MKLQQARNEITSLSWANYGEWGESGRSTRDATGVAGYTDRGGRHRSAHPPSGQ